MKRCSSCGKLKDESEFYHYKSSKDGLTHQCKQCMSEYRTSKREHYREYMAYRREVDNETIKANRRKHYRNHPENRMLMQAKQRAKRRNLEFNLTIDDIVIPVKCPLLGVPFVLGVQGNYEYTPSLDRIDPNKGYIKGNVWVITKKANSMKNSATKEELLKFADNIYKYFGDNDIVQPIEKSIELQDKEPVG